MQSIYEWSLKLGAALSSYLAAFWGLMMDVPWLMLLSAFTLICRAIIDGEKAYQLYKRWKHGRSKE